MHTNNRSWTAPRGLEAWLQMIRTFWTLQARIEDSLRKYKLTLAQFDLMAMLVTLGELNQQELANELAVTKGNMVGLVNRLSERGFVQRVPAKNGRRGNLIRLTETGRKLVAAAIPDHWRLVTEMTNPLTLEELRAMQGMLLRLEEASTQTGGRRGGTVPAKQVRKQAPQRALR